VDSGFEKGGGRIRLFGKTAPTLAYYVEKRGCPYPLPPSPLPPPQVLSCSFPVLLVRQICEKLFPFGLQALNLAQLKIRSLGTVLDMEPPTKMFGSENYAASSKSTFSTA
jgi:hypothetical protein